MVYTSEIRISTRGVKLITRDLMLRLLTGGLKDHEAALIIERLGALGIFEVVESMNGFLKNETIADFVVLSEERGGMLE